jgi:UDP-N-acetylglucosamine 2-epimerase (non-hydrolysing)
MKTVLTITGIRPDFIRMSEIFEKLDKNFNHILIHTGQHYDELLSGVFFKELKIRKPDYNLSVGSSGKEHFHQLSELSVNLIKLIRMVNIRPDMILFLGDSNSVCSALPLRKEGYTIGHIEAGMRSGDKKMLEEINRTVCDHCSNYHFVYHEDYKQNLIKENLPEENIFVVGNTIVEPCKKILSSLNLGPKENSHILMDIHRPENFKHKNRLENIIEYAETLSKIYKIPVKMLDFKRTREHIENFGISTKGIQIIDLMSYVDFIKFQYHSKFIISDSGTAQEEPALLETPVLVPRDYAERPQSVNNGCSVMIDVNSKNQCGKSTWFKSYQFIDTYGDAQETHDREKWLGDGETSTNIINKLKKIL